jgi:hypothetical protein
MGKEELRNPGQEIKTDKGAAKSDHQIAMVLCAEITRDRLKYFYYSASN